jgi:hypothetical protein
MIVGREAFDKLRGLIGSGIYFAANLLLRLQQRRGDFPQAHIADNEEVDITDRRFFRAGNRAIDKRDLNSGGKRPERTTKQIDETGSLGEQTTQLEENGAFPIRLNEKHSSFTTALEDADSSQFDQLPLQAGS